MISNATPAPLAKLREQFEQCRGIGKRAVFPQELTCIIHEKPETVSDG